jgi:hypothetical protein
MRDRVGLLVRLEAVNRRNRWPGRTSSAGCKKKTRFPMLS